MRKNSTTGMEVDRLTRASGSTAVTIPGARREMCTQGRKPQQRWRWIHRTEEAQGALGSTTHRHPPPATWGQATSPSGVSNSPICPSLSLWRGVGITLPYTAVVTPPQKRPQQQSHPRKGPLAPQWCGGVRVLVIPETHAGPHPHHGRQMNFCFPFALSVCVCVINCQFHSLVFFSLSLTLSFIHTHSHAHALSVCMCEQNQNYTHAFSCVCVCVFMGYAHYTHTCM